MFNKRGTSRRLRRLLVPLLPLLGPLADNGGDTFTHALPEGSPALDAGSCSDLSADQRGKPRPADLPDVANVHDGCDIGAYEYALEVFLPLVLRNYP